MTTMMDVLRCICFTRGPSGYRLPVLFTAEPGEAKSDQMAQLAAEWGWPLKILSPGETQDAEYASVPYVRDAGTDRARIDCPPHAWLDEFEADALDGDGRRRGLVFLDERLDVRKPDKPSVNAITWAGRVGGHDLGPYVRVLLAGNTAEDSANGTPLTPVEVNRMLLLPWLGPDGEAWGAYEGARYAAGVEAAAPAPRDAAAEEARVDAAWPDAYARVLGPVRAWVRGSPERLHKMPRPRTPQASLPWPSKRSWSLYVHAATGARLHGLDAVWRDRLLVGAVGEGAAKEFRAFEADLALPDPLAWVDGVAAFDHDPARFDRTLALYESVAGLLAVETTPARQERARLFGARLLAASQQAGERRVSQDLIIKATDRMVQARLASCAANKDGSKSPWEELLAAQCALRSATAQLGG